MIRLLWLPVAIAVTFGLAMIALSVRNDMAWESFKREHDCKITKRQGLHTAWTCNDGITYWR